MVSAEKNYDEAAPIGGSGKRSKNSASSKRPQLKRDDSATSDGFEDEDNGMRVGGDYQASIPEYPRGVERYPECLPEKALLVWSPSPDTSEAKLDEFLVTAKEKYGYNAEQALGMLFWHKHDLSKAFIDLPNFTPFPDEWTVEDKVLFEQAFQFHGKSFTRIKQMLPDKSVASLVKYYYSWKKTRCRTSLMDRQARKRANQREDGGDAASEECSNSESDAEGDKSEKDSSSSAKVSCANCSVQSSLTQSTPKGHLCPSCFHYWRRTGSQKPTNVASKKMDSKDRHGTLKSKRKPPRGMHLNHEDLNGLALGPPTQGDSILKSMDSEVISLKRRVQNNKQIVSALKHKTLVGIDDFRPSESQNRLNSRWSNDELLLAVQGVRKYGKDFKAIAELIGNKSETHIRSFFVNYSRRFNLDAVVQEYEAENGPIVEDEEADKKMDVDISPDHSGSNSGSGTTTPIRGATPSSSAQPPPPTTTTSTTAGSSMNCVPPPLLKPVQSPSIMNRSVQPSQSSSSLQPNRFPPSSRSGGAPQQPPPPLIRPNSSLPQAGLMRPSHNQPTQLSSRE